MSISVLILTCVMIQGILAETYSQQPKESYGDDMSTRYHQLKLLEYTLDNATSEKNDSLYPVYENCKAYVTEFSQRAADFIHCSVDNARPFRFCEYCVVHYTKAVTVYNDIEQNHHEEGSNCRDILLNSDRVQIINSVNKDIRKIWKNADCEKCFSFYTESSNGTVSSQLTFKTQEFVDYYKNFTNCIPSDVHPLVHNASICSKCLPYYTKMNDIFKSLLNVSLLDRGETVHSVCMDIVDMMNYTRLMWGQQLECTVVYKDYPSVLALSIVMLLTPIVFYISMAVYGTKKERKLITHKRLTSSQNNYGSIDVTLNVSNDADSSGTGSMAFGLESQLIGSTASRSTEVNSDKTILDQARSQEPCGVDAVNQTKGRETSPVLHSENRATNQIRGLRHTALSDSEIEANADKQLNNMKSSPVPQNEIKRKNEVKGQGHIQEPQPQFVMNGNHAHKLTPSPKPQTDNQVKPLSSSPVNDPSHSPKPQNDNQMKPLSSSPINGPRQSPNSQIDNQVKPLSSSPVNDPRHSPKPQNDNQMKPLSSSPINGPRQSPNSQIDNQVKPLSSSPVNGPRHSPKPQNEIKAVNKSESVSSNPEAEVEIKAGHQINNTGQIQAPDSEITSQNN